MSPWARGSIVLARFRGAPIRLHWTALIGFALFSRFSIDPAAWVAFLAVILVHELGHAIFVRRANAQVDELVIYGLGGECAWSGDVSPWHRALIAWGGVFGQLFALFVALILLAVLPTMPPFAHAFLTALVWPNLQLAAINLVPIKPLDGAEAWALPGILWRRLRRGRTRGQEKKRVTRLRLEARDRARVEVHTLEDEGPLTDEAHDVIERARLIALRASRPDDAADDKKTPRSR
jgi:stage IV sporulation protein FB